MAETLGTRLRGGFAREAVVTQPTWPAAAPALVTRLLPLLGLQPTDGVRQQAYTALPDGGYGTSGVEVLGLLPEVAVPLQACYEGLEALWACALGYMARRISGTVMPELLAAGVYRHLFEVDTALSTGVPWDATADGFLGGELAAGQRRVRRGTVAVDVQTSVWEWTSAMVQALTLHGEPGGCTLTVELVAQRLGRTSPVNTAATLAAALPAAAPRLLFSDLTWRVAPYSTSTPLAASDVVRPSAWTLRLENRLSAAPGPGTGTAPLEYERTQPGAQVTVTFVVPRHSADTWQTRWGAASVVMAEARFVSERTVAAGQPYRLTCTLPSCVVTAAPFGVSGADVPPDTVSLVAVVPAGQAAGFPLTQHRGPLAVEVVSSVAQHPLL